jgi:hypothetical protein
MTQRSRIVTGFTNEDLTILKVTRTPAIKSELEPPHYDMDDSMTSHEAKEEEESIDDETRNRWLKEQQDEEIIAKAELELQERIEIEDSGISMTEYVKNHYKDSNGKNLFTEIIGPINGQILFQYNQATKNQTESLLDVIKQRLQTT